MSDMNVSAAELRQFIERIETLEEEKDSIAESIREVYSEAKAQGFDVKTMRSIVKLRAMDRHKRIEQEALLETYKSALGLAE